MKSRLERIANLLIFAPVIPLACFLVGWWGGYALLPESWIPISAISGLVLGLLLDIPIIKRILKPEQPIPLVYGAIVLIIYAVAMFGFFMGMPVFHVLLSIPASLLVGARLARGSADDLSVKKYSFFTALFTTSVLDLVFMISAYIALVSPSTPADLQGLLSLRFEISRAMILVLIIGGGMLLLLFNFFFTREATRFFHGYFSSE